MLYFATHGISDAENAVEKSFIALSGDTQESAYLTTKEFQHRQMKAKLVVLSACQTGLGQTHDGGIIGLARGFQKAGASDVLMSLWNISDKETTVLMDLFFEYFRKGNGKATPQEALRQAILEYRKNNKNANPKYWASFSVFGIPYFDSDKLKKIKETELLQKTEKPHEIKIYNPYQNRLNFCLLGVDKKGNFLLLYPMVDYYGCESIEGLSEIKLEFKKTEKQVETILLVASKHPIENFGKAQILLLSQLKDTQQADKEILISKIDMLIDL